VIGHALELAARDLGVGLLAVTFAAVALVAVMLLTGAILRRADRHHDALVERNWRISFRPNSGPSNCAASGCVPTTRDRPQASDSGRWSR
jgi:hypothetical protein